MNRVYNKVEKKPGLSPDFKLTRAINFVFAQGLSDRFRFFKLQLTP
jgi:hypothetical protein